MHNQIILLLTKLSYVTDVNYFSLSFTKYILYW